MFDEYKVNVADYIDENTKLAVDCDSIIFKVASISEKREIEAIEKSTGKSFGIHKNKTEFYGRTKSNKAGTASILNDINIERKVNGHEEFLKDEFEIRDIQTRTVSMNDLQRNVELYLNDISRVTTIPRDRFIYVCGESGINFRKNLLLPKQYKSNRDESLRPLVLKELGAWFINEYNIKPSHNIESDDTISMYQMKGYQDYMRTGKFSYMVSSIDKDQLGVASLFFNYDKVAGDFKDVGIYKIPDLSSDVGKLKLTKGKLKGLGFKWVVAQGFLMSDPTDGTYGYQHFPHIKGKYGEATIFADLTPMKTQKEVLEYVKMKWLEWFPSGRIEYTDWKGDPHNVPWHEFVAEVFLATWMRRSKNDSTTLYTIFDHFGVDVYE